MPVPSEASPLVQAIRSEIQKSPDGAIPFRVYMNLCLYHPQFGYYTGNREKLGKEGDYYTSSSIGGIMGEMIARFYLRKAETQTVPLSFVEWGGGTGRLANQILNVLSEANPACYSTMIYTLVEISPYHRRRQMETLANHRERVRIMTPEQWEQSEDRNRPSFLFCNELLDAFPVHRVRCRDGELKELYVIWDDAAGRFDEREQPCDDPKVREYIHRHNIRLREGQTAEINRDAEQWIQQRMENLKEGYLLAVDYGDEAEEIYGEHRMNGTLMGYRDHQAFDDPFRCPGEQDLTSHVDFSACIRAGMESGAAEWKLQTQKEFLVETGVLDLLQNHTSTDPFGPEAKRNRAIRQLLLSDQMSELFKVLLLTKNRT